MKSEMYKKICEDIADCKEKIEVMQALLQLMEYCKERYLEKYGPDDENFTSEVKKETDQ